MSEQQPNPQEVIQQVRGALYPLTLLLPAFRFRPILA
jgi:hypothetical protein